MDYLALKAEVTSDPVGLGYAKFLPDSGGSVVDLLNKLTTTKVKPRYVTTRTIQSEVDGGAVALDKLEAASPNIPDLKYALVFLKQDSGFDLGNPKAQGMMTQLATFGVLSPAESTALKNLALQPASRAEVLGLGRVTELDLIAALKGVA